MKVSRLIIAGLGVALMAAATMAQEPPATSSSTTAKEPAAQPRGTRALPQEGRPISLNSASTADLERLPGVGQAQAAAIVKGRPYRSKDELLTRPRTSMTRSRTGLPCREAI